MLPRFSRGDHPAGRDIVAGTCASGACAERVLYPLRESKATLKENSFSQLQERYHKQKTMPPAVGATGAAGPPAAAFGFACFYNPAE